MGTRTYNTKPHESLVQWQRNRELLSKLPAAHHDWIVTVAFYTALHAVETLLLVDDVSEHETHRDRNTRLLSPRYEVIYPSYDQLYNLAHVARYSAQPRRWINYTDIAPKLIDGSLIIIEKEVCRLLTEVAEPTVNVPTLTPIVLVPP